MPVGPIQSRFPRHRVLSLGGLIVAGCLASAPALCSRWAATWSVAHPGQPGEAEWPTVAAPPTVNQAPAASIALPGAAPARRWPVELCPPPSPHPVHQASLLTSALPLPRLRDASAPEAVVGRPTDEAIPYNDDIKPLSETSTLDLQPSRGEMPASTPAKRSKASRQSSAAASKTADRSTWSTSGNRKRFATSRCTSRTSISRRYGYTHGFLQPAVSAIHFFGTIPLLPYKMGMHPPTECIYTLGHYRPGTPCPYQTSRLGWSWRGALLEAEAICTFIFWIPSGKFY